MTLIWKIFTDFNLMKNSENQSDLVKISVRILIALVV